MTPTKPQPPSETITAVLEEVGRLDREATSGPWIDTSTETEVRPIQAVIELSHRDDGAEGLKTICVDEDGDDNEEERKLICSYRTLAPRLARALKYLVKYTNEAQREEIAAILTDDKQGGGK